MGGYCDDKVVEVLVPSDQEAWSKFQSVERWKQWGVNAEDIFGSVDNSAGDEGDISCETLMDELEMDCRVGEEEENESEISGVRGGGGISEYSSNCWTTFLNNNQLDGFPRTVQTDENFVNSMLLDDERVGEQYQRTYSTGNNLDAMERSHEHFEAPVPLNLFNWEKQTDVSHENMSNSVNNDVPPRDKSPLGNLEIFASVEETALRDFGKAMYKMTENTRLCFRDALYRLASNSAKHPGDLDKSLRSADKHASESRTKAIDITIADLMFNEAYQQYDDCYKP